MPKGVEHGYFLLAPEEVAAVPPSVMPKGVEHASSSAVVRSRWWGAPLCDAERR
jgi:hypothetical protein